MKAISSNEKSKKVWQFIFILAALCLFPIMAIFFSYNKSTEPLTNEEKEKIKEFENYEKSQKEIVIHLKDIDSNFKSLALDNTTQSSSALIAKINNDNLEMKKIDDGKLVLTLSKMIANHVTSMKTLIENKEKLAKIRDTISEMKEN